MFRHDNVGGDEEVVAETELFEGVLEEFSSRWVGEKTLTPLGGERDEWKMSGLLMAGEILRHERHLALLRFKI